MKKNRHHTRTAKLPATLLLASTLLLGASTCFAQDASVQAAVSEAIAVHGMATASRICGFMTEAELTRVRMRMDRVHAAQLAPQDQETYLIMRTSDDFRNYVYAKALSKAQAGCGDELRTAWSELNSSLIFADITSQDVRASASEASAVTKY